MDGPPECDLINFCPPRGGKTNKRSNSHQHRGGTVDACGVDPAKVDPREAFGACGVDPAKVDPPEAFGSPSNMKFHNLTVAQLVERGTVIALQRISLGRWFESVR